MYKYFFFACYLLIIYFAGKKSAGIGVARPFL